VSVTTPREFEQGQAVFDAEGKPGEITQAFFDFDFGDWIYTVSGLGTKAEIELTAFAPEFAEPEEPTLGEGDPEIEEEIETEAGTLIGEEIYIGTSRDISGYRVPPSGLSRSDVEAIVRSWVNLHRIEVNNALEALESDTEAMDKLSSDLDTLRDSISQIVVEQVSIEDRREAEKDALEEVEETSLGGFIRNVGGFLLSPFDKIKNALEEHILGEVRDGLNR
jgi:hypothetical protein